MGAAMVVTISRRNIVVVAVFQKFDFVQEGYEKCNRASKIYTFYILRPLSGYETEAI